MARQNINILDFDLFCEVMKTVSKIVDSAKFTIGKNGVETYGARNKIARCEISSNAVTSDEQIEFSVENVQLLLKIMQSVKNIHAGDYSGLKFVFDSPFLRFESKKLKMKFSTCNENIISQWISKKVEAELTPVFEFSSTGDMIKAVNGHLFMFSEPKDVRIYLETKPDMENNAVFATLGNEETAYNNEMTLKFGLVTFGTLSPGGEEPDRRIIIDIERLNLFNAVQTDRIKFSLMDKNCLVSRASIKSQNGSYFDFSLYSTILKK